MALAMQTIQDSRWRTIIKAIISSTNTNVLFLDASSLVGHSAGSIVNLKSIEWSVDAGTQILWDASSNVVALHFTGNGHYGGSDGMPAIPNNAGSGITGDVLVTTDVKSSVP